MAHLYLAPETDSLYLDVTAGNRPASTMTVVADGVYLHVDAAGELVAIEVMNLSARGGLKLSDLDAAAGNRQPTLFQEIEERAAHAGLARRPGQNGQQGSA